MGKASFICFHIYFIFISYFCSYFFHTFFILFGASRGRRTLCSHPPGGARGRCTLCSHPPGGSAGGGRAGPAGRPARGRPAHRPDRAAPGNLAPAGPESRTPTTASSSFSIPSRAGPGRPQTAPAEQAEPASLPHWLRRRPRHCHDTRPL